MFYISVKLPPSYHQMTLEEFLFGSDDVGNCVINENLTNTRTYEVDNVSERFLRRIKVDKLVEKLQKFNEQTADLRDRPRHDLYRTFYIPKKSGGLRRIDAPDQELMNALRRLKDIFENDFNALYHTSAFAYIKNRSTIDAVKRHQDNESKWFGKFDLSNFFGSTTLEYVMKMLSMIFPFSEVMKTNVGEDTLRTAIELAFLDGALPQGTPISPLITNIIMIPVDYKLANGLREYNHQRFVYTRYADDFIISSKYEFNVKEIEGFIIKTLKEFDAPFSLNQKKTRYGSSAGSNWNLGVVLNRDNEITIGHKKKKQFQAMLSSYIMDKKNGVQWDKHDIQTMEGHRNYYRMVEGDTIDRIIDHINQKFDVNVVKMIKADLKA